jgi:hypothetical protein
MSTKRKPQEGYHMPEKRRAKRQRERMAVASQRAEAYHSRVLYESMGVDGCWQRRAIKGGG